MYSRFAFASNRQDCSLAATAGDDSKNTVEKLGSSQWNLTTASPCSLANANGLSLGEN
jgi:hypothetical protein